MQTKSIISALKRHGIETKKITNTFHDQRGMSYENYSYYATGKDNCVTWHEQDGRAICVNVKGDKEETDIQSDYFPGFFAKTIKQIIHHLT